MMSSRMCASDHHIHLTPPQQQQTSRSTSPKTPSLTPLYRIVDVRPATQLDSEDEEQEGEGVRAQRTSGASQEQRRRNGHNRQRYCV